MTIFDPVEYHSKRHPYFPILIACGAICMILGLVGLVGWISPYHIINQTKADYIPMASDTALFFTGFGFALWAEAWSLYNRLKEPILPLVLIAVTTIYSLLKFIEYWAGVDLTFAELFTPEQGRLAGFPTNRMSPISGLLFFLSGSGFLLKDLLGKHIVVRRIINYLGLLISAAGVVIVIGYTFGTPFSYGGHLIPLAFTTSLGFMFLGVGIIALADRQSSIYRHFSGHTARGRLMRSILPLVAFAILLEGYLHMKLMARPDINQASVSAAITMAFVFITAWVISYVTRRSFRKAEEVEQERASTLEELRESEERFRKTFETNIASVTINRLEDYAFVDVNTGFTDLTGYTLDDLIGRTIIDIDFWENPELIGPLDQQVRKTGGMDNVQIHFRKKDGTIFPGLCSARVIMLKGIPHLMTITLDISDLKEKERELIKAKQAAENANNLKDFFVANVSHEIRTPLNAIIGFTDLLVEDVMDTLPIVAKKYSPIINQASKRLLRTVDMMLNMSRMKARLYETKYVTVNLTELITGLVEEHALEAATKGVDCVFSHDDISVVVQSDFNCLSQSISNLINNAVKYTSRGSVRVTLTELPDLVEIIIQDTGIGINEAFIQNIFEPYTQENMSYSRDYEGIGLGLAITKQMLDAIGARISVFSEKNVGSIFTVTVARN